MNFTGEKKNHKRGRVGWGGKSCSFHELYSDILKLKITNFWACEINFWNSCSHNKDCMKGMGGYCFVNCFHKITFLALRLIDCFFFFFIFCPAQEGVWKLYSPPQEGVWKRCEGDCCQHCLQIIWPWSGWIHQQGRIQTGSFNEKTLGFSWLLIWIAYCRHPVFFVDLLNEFILSFTIDMILR